MTCKPNPHVARLVFSTKRVSSVQHYRKKSLTSNENLVQLQLGLVWQEIWVISLKNPKTLQTSTWLAKHIQTYWMTYGRRKRKTDILKSGWPYAFAPNPPYGQLFVNFFGVFFYLRLWFYVFWNGFYTRKVIFIQLQEFPTPPYCRCCSVTKRSDSGIAEALKALKMHFWDPSQWDKMCFEYHRVIFHWKKRVKIFTFAYSQGRRGWPSPPYGQPDRKISILFDDFSYDLS